MAGKYLIVYYSSSGTTHAIAQSLAEVLEGDIEEIVEPSSRAGFLGYARSLMEVFRKRPSASAHWKSDPTSYDLVLIGTPVWAWSVSSPVRAYLMANKARFREVAFFCTLGGSGSESAFEQMQGLIGKAPRAVCAFTASEVNSGRYRPRLVEFAKAARLAVAGERRA